MWKSIIELIKAYLYNMREDPDGFVTILRLELIDMGIIDSENTMTYTSPDNLYIFKIERIDNAYIDPEIGSQYTNIITIYNNLNIKLCEMRFNEFDCVKILSNIAQFVDGVYNDMTTDTYFIHIGLDVNMINTLFRISVSEYDMIPFTLKVQQYNPHLGQMADIVTMHMEIQDLVDFAFRIFFQCIIDLDYTPFYEKGLQRDLTYIEGFVIDDNSLYVQYREENAVPTEYVLNFGYDIPDVTNPYNHTEVPQNIQYSQVVPPSDTQIEHLTKPKRNKNTVLGLYSSKKGRKP